MCRGIKNCYFKSVVGAQNKSDYSFYFSFLGTTGINLNFGSFFAVKANDAGGGIGIAQCVDKLNHFFPKL